MWDQTDGCAKQYRCSIAYYLMSYLSKSYQIVLDRAVNTTGLSICMSVCRSGLQEAKLIHYRVVTSATPDIGLEDP